MVVFTLAVEALVVIALTLGLWLGAGRSFGQALWQGTFHGVAAFNQAGFSLYSDSLVGFASDGFVLLPIAFGIIVGGVGFPVWLELRRRPRSPGRWSLHTKLTLVTTGALLAAGFIALTAMEWQNDATLGGESAAGQAAGRVLRLGDRAQRRLQHR